MINKIPAAGLEQGNKINLAIANGTTPNLTPPINFLNDLGTGIFSPSPGVTAIASSGVEVLRFTPNGIETENGIYGGQNPDFTATNVVLYVNRGDLNSTDSVLNSGGNLNTPFKTIERALLEVGRRSFVSGINNDTINGYTVMVYPGEYLVDNRPGLKTAAQIPNITQLENELYKFNPSFSGGIVVPRGTSIIAIDPRKTTIRPKYVPDPTLTIPGVMYDGAAMINKNFGYIVEQTYLKLIQDYPTITNINATCKRDIGLVLESVVLDLQNGGNSNSYVAGEAYISGTNLQYITGLEITAAISAYNRLKVLAIATVLNNWTGYTELTVNKTIDRYVPVVVVDYAANGDCSSVSSAITTLLDIVIGIISNPTGYSSTFYKINETTAETPILKVTGSCYISNITFADAKETPYKLTTYSGDVPAFSIATNAQYSHHKLVAFGFVDQRNSYGELTEYYKKIDAWDLTIDGGGQRETVVDEYTIVSTLSNPNSVKGASPYIFGCAVRSVYGLNGLLVDGKKVSSNSLKSFVLAQFTTISLQLDPNAYVTDLTDVIDSTAYNYINYGYKVINDAYAQIVSCFAIGQARQFITQTGGEVSINNSTSNFGGVSLYSSGNSKAAVNQDTNYNILGIIPPKLIGLDYRELNIGTINTNTVTTTSITVNNLNTNGGTLIFPIDSYIYINIVDPTNIANIVRLQAKMQTTNINSSAFSVVNGSGTSENSIYLYLNCLGAYRYESTWYTTGSLPAAEAIEIAARKAALATANLFIQRLVDNRTPEEKNYQVVVASPTTKRLPTNNYVISQASIFTPINKYFVTNIVDITAAELNSSYNNQGDIVKVKILRANRNSTIGVGGDYPDNIDDLVPTPAYITTTNNLDPRLFVNTIVPSVDQTAVSYLAIRQFLLDFGYSNIQADTILTPNAGASLLSSINSLITITNKTNSTSTGAAIKFNLLKPSIIRCSNHTWEYVGYKNYSTALPRLQIKTLSKEIKYKAIQSSLNGGVVYATGMDEVGNLYQGNNVIDLTDNTSSSIRFDGLTSNNGNNGNNYFTDITVSNLSRLNIANINRLAATTLEFSASSALKMNLGNILSDIVDSNIPVGLKSTAAKYGLVRKATPTEITNYTGDGYVTPVDLEFFGLNIASLTTFVNDNTVKTTGDQTVAGVKTFSSSPKVPNGATGLDAVNYAQLISATGGVPITNSFNRLLIDNLQIVTGTLALTVNWNAGGVAAVNVTFTTAAGFVTYAGTPKVFISIDRLVIYQVVPFNTYFEFSADALPPNYAPNDGIISWMAIGYI
jgi:hypothetical protein